MSEPTGPNLHLERSRDPEGFARSIERLRDAVGDYLEEVSLREAARQIGMSPTGLANFVNGTEPYMHTIRKLRAWHAARLDTRGCD